MRRNEQEIKDHSEILAIMQKAEVCRVAFHDEPYPYIVPFNFGFEYSEKLCIYFHCAREGKKLDLIRRNNRVCFELEADTAVRPSGKACGWSMQYKSVIGFGDIEIVEEPARIKVGLDILMKHYSGRSHHTYQPDSMRRSLILKLTVTTITGKRHGNS